MLGVSRDASAADVKNAFYELSKRYHPDTAAGNAGSGGDDDSLRADSAQKFLELKEAYDVLRDEARRRDYDHRLYAGGADASYPSPPHGSGATADDYPFTMRRDHGAGADRRARGGKSANGHDDANGFYTEEDFQRVCPSSSLTQCA